MEHTPTCECPAVLTRAADLCPSCQKEWREWLGEQEPSPLANVALEIAFAFATWRKAVNAGSGNLNARAHG
jgi:hypothetical protein